MTPEPRYEHDQCRGCVFLGYFSYFDLWYCSQLNDPTVIARWSDADEAYMSGMEYAWDERAPHENPLIVARLRAEKMGLNCNSDTFHFEIY